MIPAWKQILILLAVVCTFFACKKDDDSPAASAINTEIIPAGDTLRHIITDNTLLTNTHTWYVDGWTYVSNESTLRIEPGTEIRVLTHNTRNKENAGGGLVITRGSKIVAAGMPALPVHFILEDTIGCNGVWSGIIVLGKAPLQTKLRITNNVLLPGGNELAYGGTLPDDSSGVLRYVRIDGVPCNTTKGKFPSGLLLLGIGSKTDVREITIYPVGSEGYLLKNTKIK